MGRKEEIKNGVRVMYEIYRIARKKKIDFVAGGITYYALFSMVPIIILTFIALSVIGGKGLATYILTAAGGVLPPIGQELVQKILTEESGQTGIIGLMILFWGSLQLFRSFDIAFEQIYDSEHAETLIEEVEDALTALITMSIAIILTVLIGILILTTPSFQMSGLFWTAAQFLGLTAVFIPLYHVFTDEPYSFRELLPGALLAAAGWTLLQTVFHIYANYIGGSIYSVFGGILLLILWIYFGNILILLGAIVNLVYSQHR